MEVGVGLGEKGKLVFSFNTLSLSCLLKTQVHMSNRSIILREPREKIGIEQGFQHIDGIEDMGLSEITQKYKEGTGNRSSP